MVFIGCSIATQSIPIHLILRSTIQSARNNEATSVIDLHEDVARVLRVGKGDVSLFEG